MAPSKKGSRTAAKRQAEKEKKKMAVPAMAASSSSVTVNEETEEGVLVCRYVSSGSFEEDFTRLCRQLDMAVIPPLVYRPGGPTANASIDAACDSKLPHVTSAGLKQQLRKRSFIFREKVKSQVSFKEDIIRTPLATERPSEMTIISEESAHSDQSFSFRVKDKFQYFKPCVQVEYTDPSDPGSVTEIYIRGWKVDMPMAEVLNKCLPPLAKLKTLLLWNAGLTDMVLEKLAFFLPLCQELTSLTLDANSLADANVSSLIGDKSRLKDLSLRFCQLTDVNAMAIGRALGTAISANKTLQSLNLANNYITDSGATQLAEGLKTNRSLLVLNLAGNQIGDVGAAAFAETLSQFLLSTEQMKERRVKFSERDRLYDTEPLTAGSRRSSDSIGMELTFKPKRPASRDRESSSNLLVDKKRRDKGNVVAGPRRGRMKERDRDKDSFSVDSGSRKMSIRRRSRQMRRKEVPMGGDWHALMEVGTHVDGQLWMLGNRSIISLNLSRNRIGLHGITCLLHMAEMQAVPFHGQRQTGTGLKRLAVHRNALSSDHRLMALLEHRMLTKDPLHRVPLIALSRDSLPPCALPPIHC